VISSVAVPIHAARGRIANAAVMKTIKSPHSKKWAARDMGINSSRMLKIMFLIDIFTLSLGDFYTMSKISCAFEYLSYLYISH
jgi:hypothetical protein